LRDDFCDGLGNCLPVCPCGAIKIEAREAEEYDADAVAARRQGHKPKPVSCLCPGIINAAPIPSKWESKHRAPTNLKQWPVQIKLINPRASSFDNAHLLIAADCTAYTFSNFHTAFMKKRVTVIGCPKLDEIDYSEKLGAILSTNAVQSVVVVRMEVPCCGGLENAARTALQMCGKDIPITIAVISTDGRILS